MLPSPLDRSYIAEVRAAAEALTAACDTWWAAAAADRFVPQGDPERQLDGTQDEAVIDALDRLQLLGVVNQSA